MLHPKSPLYSSKLSKKQSWQSQRPHFLTFSTCVNLAKGVSGSGCMSQCPRVGMSQTGPNQVQCRAATLEVETKLSSWWDGEVEVPSRDKIWTYYWWMLSPVFFFDITWFNGVFWDLYGSTPFPALKVNPRTTKLRDSESGWTWFYLTKLQIPLNTKPFLGRLWWILTSSDSYPFGVDFTWYHELFFSSWVWHGLTTCDSNFWNEPNEA